MRNPKPCLILLTLLILFGAGSIELVAQPQFKLKRTNKESQPLFITILGGYNGVSDPAEVLQDQIRDFDDNAYGGLMAGLQAGVVLDTVFQQPFWVGGEFYYHRYVNRLLRGEWPRVHYLDEPDVPVDYIEELHAIGIQLILAYDVYGDFQIQLGGGVQYLYPVVEIPSEVVGLFVSAIIPTATLAVRYSLLTYDHGSIDLNLRGMQGFGEYGSSELQSLLGFNFRF